MFGLTRFVGITVVLVPPGLVNAVADDDEMLHAVAEDEEIGGREYREDGGVFGSEPGGEPEGREEVERMESLGWTTACPEAYIQSNTLSYFLLFIFERIFLEKFQLWWRLNLSWHAP
jgi:hypothetical protein